MALLKVVRPMLDEQALRRPTFSEGSKIKLADSQDWTFPPSRVRFRPRLVGDKIEVGGGASFGPEFDDRLDVLFGVVDAEPTERLRVEFEVVVRLLQANYDLTVPQIADLIEMEPGNPASDDRWDQIRNVVRGLPPKLTADISGSPA